MAKRFDGVKRESWRERLRKHAGSGLTVAEFCRRQHVSQASFYYWAKRIRPVDHDGATQRSQREDLAASSDETNDFVEVVVSDSIRVRMRLDRLDDVVALIRQLQQARPGVDDATPTSRFQRIQLAPPTQP